MKVTPFSKKNLKEQTHPHPSPIPNPTTTMHGRGAKNSKRVVFVSMSTTRFSNFVNPYLRFFAPLLWSTGTIRLLVGTGTILLYCGVGDASSRMLRNATAM